MQQKKRRKRIQRQRINQSQLKANLKPTTIVVLDSETQISQQQQRH
jgi:hypothetical protein